MGSKTRSQANSTIPIEPLGDFLIVREIGRGGMGVVYEAIQKSLGRRVALKVLPFAAAFDNKQLQRFRHEAQAAAQLHHPHIVPVFGVGCERGTHFYAMQLIEGQNLASVIRQLQGDKNLKELSGDAKPDIAVLDVPITHDDPPSIANDTCGVFGSQLSTVRIRRAGDYFRTIARLIVQAADGLDYAHGMGIVHRDVKPANILVDEGGEVWVTDFGLAQLQTGVNLTRTGELLGTLRYMSPEQAGGQHVLVDQRTDVYSLGATLYELLTLQPIFDGNDHSVLLRRILDESPLSPRKIDAAIPVELETITLKALGKTPSERYTTARQMADDLRRFLENRPIHARPPSLLERAAKWGRRHRAIVASAIVTLLMSVAALSVATVLIARAYDRERERADEVAEQYERAEANFRQARMAVDEFTRISEEQLRDHPKLEAIRVRMLEAALAYYQEFVDQHFDNPKLQAELEASRSKVESILDELTIVVDASRYILLQSDTVQQELKLTEDQRMTVMDIDQQWRDALKESGRMKRQDWERQRLELAQKQQEIINHLLSPAQTERFRQIVLQSKGPTVFVEPEVISMLDLTEKQLAEIQTILNDLNVFWMGLPPPPLEHDRLFGRFEPPPKPLNRKPHEREELFAKAMLEILNLLTDEQRQKWEQLTGKSFQIEDRSLHMGMPMPFQFNEFRSPKGDPDAL